MKRIILIAAPLLIAFSGCDWKPYFMYRRSVVVYEDVEVCGVTNPVENIDWLNDIHCKYDSIVHHTDAYFYRVLLVLVNDSTGERFIYDGPDSGTSQDVCYTYDCDGLNYVANHITWSESEMTVKPLEAPNPHPSCDSIPWYCHSVGTIAVYSCQ